MKVLWRFKFKKNQKNAKWQNFTLRILNILIP